MDGRILTHLSANDINEYLLGGPDRSRFASTEEHFRSCADCLEQMWALTASIDHSQLRNRPGLGSPPSSLRPWQPLFPNYGWALKTAAAGLMLLAVPDSTRFIHMDRLFESPLQASTLQLTSTRMLPEELVLMTAPKVRLAARTRPGRQLQRGPAKRFEAPSPEIGSRMLEAAMLEPPQLDVAGNSPGPALRNFEPPQVDAYRSKPGFVRRLLSVVASPFRAPRS